MIRYLEMAEVLELQQLVLAQTGGTAGIREIGGLSAALAQPRQTFAGADLYPTTVAKAAALSFFLVRNHPFIDGNKRIGHAAMEVFLIFNGMEMQGDVDEQERMVFALAAGQLTLEPWQQWVERQVQPSSILSVKVE